MDLPTHLNNVESISADKSPELIPLNFKRHHIDAGTTVHFKRQKLEWMISETHPGLSVGPRGSLFEEAKSSGPFCQFSGGIVLFYGGAKYQAARRGHFNSEF